VRKIVSSRLEDARVRTGYFKSDHRDGLMGAFHIHSPNGRMMVIISSGPNNEYGWEHVSVSIEGRTPNWGEMAFVKDLFWDEEETVMQLHPPKSQYVNCHPHCLHLWRPIDAVIPLPPAKLVGPKREQRAE
jgi:hypothetical protein